MQVLEHPRWEDFTYTYLNPSAPFAYLGNGFTLQDVDPTADKAAYLDDAFIDV